MSAPPPLTAAALLKASVHALRSYEFGNGSSELAKECADAIEAYLSKDAREVAAAEVSVRSGKEVAENRQS
jgi:hypothetical protein